MQVLDCPQNSDEWLYARLGIPTASEFKTVLAKGRNGAASQGRRTYMQKLAGERITGEPADSFTNRHIERGHDLEPEARAYYAFETDNDPQLVGLILADDGNVGCSPDSLVGENGLLEIKTALPHILIDTILKDDFPPAHKAQCQGQLWISEREWVDIVVYYPNMPTFIKRAYRDEEYIAKLAQAVSEFNEELLEMVERVNCYGMKEAA
jgi:hypothetical protein